MRKKYMICIIILMLSSAIFADWELIYGGGGGEFGYAVMEIVGVGYFVSGAFGGGNFDFLLIHISDSGEFLWRQIYGGDDYEYSIFGICTRDKGFAIIGNTYSFASDGVSDVYFVKTDTAGIVEWERVYGFGGDEMGFCVKQTMDDGYIIVGIANTGDADDDILLIKTDSVGDTVWTKVYGESNHDMPYTIDVTSDGGYILVANTSSFGGDGNIWIIKLDYLGDSLWTKVYGATEYFEDCYSIIQTSDRNYVLTGIKTQLGTASEEKYAWVVKLNADGDTIWTRTYGEIGGESCGQCVIETNDGCYAIAGWTGGHLIHPGNPYDFYLFKIYDDGNLLWERRFSANDWDMAYAVMQTSDDGYLIAGYTDNGSNVADIYVVKVDAEGIVEWQNSESMDIDIKISPNPFNVSCKIESSANSTIQIVDIDGHLVNSWNNCRSILWQPDQSTVSGIYLVKATLGGKTINKSAVYVK